MSNTLKFPIGTEVYHWDLFYGWEPAVVVSSGASSGTIVLDFKDGGGPFEYEAVFVHLTKDDKLLPKIDFKVR